MAQSGGVSTLTTDREPTGYTKFDRDPEALAWARAHVQRQIDKMRRFEAKAEAEGATDPVQWRKFGNLLDSAFIGGDGCVIASFDARKPEYLAMLDGSRPATGTDF